MKNADYVRALRIVPDRTELGTFQWSVDIAIPFEISSGVINYKHHSNNGVAHDFLDAYWEAVRYIESVGA